MEDPVLKSIEAKYAFAFMTMLQEFIWLMLKFRVLFI